MTSGLHLLTGEVALCLAGVRQVFSVVVWGRGILSRLQPRIFEREGNGVD